MRWSRRGWALLCHPLILTPFWRQCCVPAARGNVAASQLRAISSAGDMTFDGSIKESDVISAGNWFSILMEDSCRLRSIASLDTSNQEAHMAVLCGVACYQPCGTALSPVGFH